MDTIYTMGTAIVRSDLHSERSGLTSFRNVKYDSVAHMYKRVVNGIAFIVSIEKDMKLG